MYTAVIFQISIYVYNISFQPEKIFVAKFKISQYMLNKTKPRPILNDIKKIKVIRGSHQLFYANEMEDDYKAATILSSAQEILLGQPWTFKKDNCGVDLKKKNSIKSLFDVIPNVYQTFWENLVERVELYDVNDKDHSNSQNSKNNRKNTSKNKKPPKVVKRLKSNRNKKAAKSLNVIESNKKNNKMGKTKENCEKVQNVQPNLELRRSKRVKMQS